MAQSWSDIEVISTSHSKYCLLEYLDARSVTAWMRYNAPTYFNIVTASQLKVVMTLLLSQLN